jgi:hypothetical protein
MIEINQFLLDQTPMRCNESIFKDDYQEFVKEVEKKISQCKINNKSRQ